MRIGKFNQIIKSAVDANGSLQTNGVPRLGGQIFVINDFNKKAELVLTLRDMKLLPENTLDTVIDYFESNKNASMVEFETAQHDEIVSLFAKINTKLPDYAEIVNNFSPDQEEAVINIKLPSNVNSIIDLSIFNKRIDDIFKKINITGNFKIIGFDTGSKWYQILIDNSWLFNYVISSISLSLQVIDFRNNRKGSDDLRLMKKAINIKDQKNTITESRLLAGMVDEKISEDVEKVVDLLGCPDNREKPETVSMILGVVKDLIKEMDKGTEFHLSLNPPKYAEENGALMSLKIDYSSLPKIDETKAVPAQIEANKTEDNSDIEQDGEK